MDGIKNIINMITSPADSSSFEFWISRFDKIWLSMFDLWNYLYLSCDAALHHIMNPFSSISNMNAPFYIEWTCLGLFRLSFHAIVGVLLKKIPLCCVLILTLVWIRLTTFNRADHRVWWIAINCCKNCLKCQMFCWNIQPLVLFCESLCVRV